MSDPDQNGGTWTLLTGHGHVLVEIARNLKARIQDISPVVGLTERSVQAIVADLEATGYLTRTRTGRRVIYTVNGTACSGTPPRKTPGRPVPRPARRRRGREHTRTGRRLRPGTGSRHAAAGFLEHQHLWVPKTYATRRYSWMTPPARSCRRTRK
jgi:hypothetical protein